MASCARGTPWALRAFLGFLTFLGSAPAHCRDSSPALFSQLRREPCVSGPTLAGLCLALESGFRKLSSLNQNHPSKGSQTPTVSPSYLRTSERAGAGNGVHWGNHILTKIPGGLESHRALLARAWAPGPPRSLPQPAPSSCSHVTFS